MNTKADPKELVVSLIKRSTCSVQVAAVIVDKWGVFSWGWNNMGPTGYGQHAEQHAMSRANVDRLAYSTIYVAAARKRNGKTVTAKPCEECQPWLDLYKMRIMYRDGDGKWRSE